MNMMQTGVRQDPGNITQRHLISRAKARVKISKTTQIDSMDAIINHGSWCIELHSGTTDIGRLSNIITTRSREECVGGDRCCAFCTDIAVYH
jgi:hypothetical protein